MCKAESYAIAEGTSYSLFREDLLSDTNSVLSIPSQEGSTLFCDNQSSVHIAQDLTSISRTKRIEVAYLSIQEKDGERRVTTKDIPMEEQCAPILSKNLSPGRFEYLNSKIILLPPMSRSEEKS